MTYPHFRELEVHRSHRATQDERLRLTFMHLADAFIQSDLQCIQVIQFLAVHVFPGNRTHNLCAANTML